MLYLNNIFAALKKWRSLLNESPFYEAEYPATFMTDDSDAERSAVSHVFPKSRRLLCHFHVMQVNLIGLLSSYKTTV
jgi:hypothetical protein